MTDIYYIEINLLCIIILLLFLHQTRYKSDRLSAYSRVFNLIMWSAILLSVSDIIAGTCRGDFFPGARVLIQTSNMLYFESISLINFLYLIYVVNKTKLFENSSLKYNRYKRYLLICSIPFIAVSVFIFTNPLTEFMFKIDENNLYSRNSGVCLHWAVYLFYNIMIFAVVIYSILKERDKKIIKNYLSLLLFSVPTIVASVAQSMFYGISCYQAGITVSIALIALNIQNAQILTDPLTGLNNRYAFKKYVESHMSRNSERHMFIMMIDVNNFKNINDEFGHMEGDRALSVVADTLKQTCQDIQPQLFVCRYGGDEFLVVGFGRQDSEIAALKEKINANLEEKNCVENYQYTLSISIGTANGTCMDADDMNHLFRVADDAMYDEKKQYRNREIHTF